jgi:hypothetical protein
MTGYFSGHCPLMYFPSLYFSSLYFSSIHQAFARSSLVLVPRPL